MASHCTCWDDSGSCEWCQEYYTDLLSNRPDEPPYDHPAADPVDGTGDEPARAEAEVPHLTPSEHEALLAAVRELRAALVTCHKACMDETGLPGRLSLAIAIGSICSALLARYPEEPKP